MDSICAFGRDQGLPVNPEEVRAHLANLDDEDSKRWVIKARGGL